MESIENIFICISQGYTSQKMKFFIKDFFS